MSDGVKNFVVSIEAKIPEDGDSGAIDTAVTQLEGLLQVALGEWGAEGTEIETSLSTYSVTTERDGERPKVERETRVKSIAKVKW